MNNVDLTQIVVTQSKAFAEADGAREGAAGSLILTLAMTEASGGKSARLAMGTTMQANGVTMDMTKQIGAVAGWLAVKAPLLAPLKACDVPASQVAIRTMLKLAPDAALTFGTLRKAKQAEGAADKPTKAVKVPVAPPTQGEAPASDKVSPAEPLTPREAVAVSFAAMQRAGDAEGLELAAAWAANAATMLREAEASALQRKAEGEQREAARVASHIGDTVTAIGDTMAKASRRRKRA